MDLGAAGLKVQPFPTHGKPSATLSYASQRAALEVLENTYADKAGLSLMQGPALSGKSTLIRSFVNSLHQDCAVAVIDGAGLNTTNLLLSVLRQFGYDVELSSPKELLGLIRVFTLQQAAYHEPPLLIIENTNELRPSALRALCELADLKVQAGSALKIVLVSDQSLQHMITAPAMASIARRLLHDFHMRPMTEQETKDYLHSKLRGAGSSLPDYVFTSAVCTELWNASGGWPGIVDRLALLALSRAESLPVAVSDVEYPALPSGTWDEEELAIAEQTPITTPVAPELVISSQGQLLRELKMLKPRVLIGRSEHNDIAIDSEYISRHHTLLVRHGASTFLMDLNSSNGTFVNSKRVSNHVLVNNDVITVGTFSIKFLDPDARERGTLEGAEFADTTLMKTLEDMRALLARENTELLPAASDE
jgi:general secretion pathway protein A